MFDGTYETDLLNPDMAKFVESFGAVAMTADDPMDLERLLPLALESRTPVVIDVPVGHLRLPRAKLQAHLPSVPWTQPQEGLISS